MAVKLAPDDLAALAEKYQTLGDLRRAHDRGEPHPPKEELRALAARFPGSLYELDAMELSVIDARRDALERALGGAAIEPWMPIMHAYHALYRVALELKPRVRRGDASDPKARAIALRNGLDDDFVRAIASPPRGRLGDVVIARVARELGVSEDDVAIAALPRPRRAPAKVERS